MSVVCPHGGMCAIAEIFGPDYCCAGTCRNPYRQVATLLPDTKLELLGGWLIQRRDGNLRMFWTVGERRPWTLSADEALRFARHDDAQGFASAMLGCDAEAVAYTSLGGVA